jgi:hypothetical protein
MTVAKYTVTLMALEVHVYAYVDVKLFHAEHKYLIISNTLKKEYWLFFVFVNYSWHKGVVRF